MIIGLTGYSGSGKDTIAQLLCDNYDFTRFAFADPLKEMMIKANLATREELYVTKPSHVRVLMQKIGTDLFRNQIDQNFWVIKMVRELKRFFKENGNDKNVVIPDARFANEADMIRYSFRPVRGIGGVIINVTRDSSVRTEHVSETEHEAIKANFCFVNNGDLKDVAVKLPYYLAVAKQSVAESFLHDFS